MKAQMLKIVFILIILTNLHGQDHWETAIFAEDDWRYIVPSFAVETGWNTIEFDVSNWDEGPGGFGYGDGDDGTIIDPAISVYFRRNFSVSDLTKLSSAVLSADYDDGFVAYLNGHEIGRSYNLSEPGTFVPYDETTTYDHEASLYNGGLPESFILDSLELDSFLTNGENVFAVQIHNVGINSSDMSGNFYLSFGITDDSEFYEDFENNSKRYDLVFKNACFYSRSIIETVKKLDKDNNTIIVFFSDHGTGLGERYGERNYGSYTYEETIRTFYLFLGKEIQKNKISSKLHSNLDIFPTILELCEIYNEKESVGRSLGKILTDESVEEFEDMYTFSETGALHGPFPSPEKSNVFCIKSNKYKLLYLEEPNIWELYDLHNDPKEKNNIIDKNFSFIEELKNKLLNWINRE